MTNADRAEQPSDVFAALSARLSEHDWRLLASIAIEHAAGLSVLTKVVPESVPIQARLDEFTRLGVLAEALAVRLVGAVAIGSEPGFTLKQPYDQLVLRAANARGLLPQLSAETRAILGSRSVADLNLALQQGELDYFRRRSAEPRLPPPTPLPEATEWLRRSIVEPFDAEWLDSVWRGRALRVAERVLTDALRVLAPCPGLFSWCAARIGEQADENPNLLRALCEYALLTGWVDELERLLTHLPHSTALGYRAAAAYVAGDLVAAHKLLDAALLGRSRARTALNFGAAAPLLCLLLLTRDEPQLRPLCKSLLGAASTGDKACARAFRTLERTLQQNHETQARLDCHQLPAAPSAWEVVLLGTAVLHSEAQASQRPSWSRYVAGRADVWRAAGYQWFSTQTAMLAQRLDPSAWTFELPRLGLCDLVAPKSEWQLALRALEDAVEGGSREQGPSYRVVWLVDGNDGSLSKPLLQEYEPKSGAWSQGRRVSLAELAPLAAELPPEDARVLSHTRALPSGQLEFEDEAYEALIGHPRVLDAMHGRRRVDVVRGQCRVESWEEHDCIHLRAEPARARLGVNVAIEGERLIVFRIDKSALRILQALPHGLRLPKSEEQELLRVLGKLSRSVEVKSPMLGIERAAVADATPCVRFSSHAGAWLVELGVRPFGQAGRFFPAGSGQRRITVMSNGQWLVCERDLEREIAACGALVRSCPTLRYGIVGESSELERTEVELDHGNVNPSELRVSESDGRERTSSWVLGETAALTLLTELRGNGVKCNLEWASGQPLRVLGAASSRSLHGRLRTTKGWYLLSGQLKLDELTEVSLSELWRAEPVRGGKFVRLADGAYVELDQRIRRIVAALRAAGSATRKSPELRLHRGALSLLNELMDTQSEIVADDDVRRSLVPAPALVEPSYDIPEALNATLRPYQIQGFQWLCRVTELGFGACLADDMGLGKTLQLIAFLLARAPRGPVLVVAPTSVCSNWLAELQRFAPSLKAAEYGADGRGKLLDALAPANVVICSYALLQQDEATLVGVDWDTVVLDEAQFIKNAESLRAKAAYRLRAACRIALTGTPVENHFGDLWSIFHFLTPGLFGEWREFKRRFVLPNERDGSEQPEVVLRELVKPFVLRRLKRDVLKELPALTEVHHEVTLSRDEAVRYTYLRKQIHEKLFTGHGKRQNKLQVLAEITRLRRFCCHPRLVFPDADTESAKMSSFLELVEELRASEHRALVFSQYVDFLQLVRERLDEQRISYEYLDGSTPKSDRQKRIDAFQHGTANLFLISLKAGGFGLNLTGADYVIHLDPWWNPAVEAQATDRAHRIGQERPVTVYRLVTKDTIEQDIVRLHDKKRQLARSVLGGTEDVAELDRDDLIRLITEAEY